MIISAKTSRAVAGVCWAVIATAVPVQVRAEDAAVAALNEETVVILKPKLAPAERAMRTRFVIGLDRKATYEIFSLANPNRVVIELSDVALRLPDASRLPSKGLVTSFRGGLAAPGRTRIVLDVAEPVIVDSAKLEKDKTKDGQFLLALDIAPVGSALSDGAKKIAGQAPAKLGAGDLQPPLPKRAENPKLRAAKAFKPMIVLDPGHGGDDTGAEKFGTVEKQVVLAFGHVLREQLEKTGRYRVKMTRDKDFFVPLDERLEIGEQHNANLFIAIHADYARSSARGATIYTLRDRVAKDLQRSAVGRAGSHVLSGKDINAVTASSGDVSAVRGILSDLAERDVEATHERTNLFARSVIETMGESTPMRNDPEQQAAFRVLKTAQFPSVLIELAYVTNRQDADNLNSDHWRAKVAESIVSAIDTYFSNQVARLPM